MELNLERAEKMEPENALDVYQAPGIRAKMARDPGRLDTAWRRLYYCWEWDLSPGIPES